ncbi:hypothetical protein D3C85_1502960 [compost metagenome]
MRLQRPDLAADGRLRHVEVLRGQRDAHAAADGDKAPDEIKRRKFRQRVWHS